MFNSAQFLTVQAISETRSVSQWESIPWISGHNNTVITVFSLPNTIVENQWKRYVSHNMVNYRTGCCINGKMIQILHGHSSFFFQISFCLITTIWTKHFGRSRPWARFSFLVPSCSERIYSLLAFVDICLFIISHWDPLSDRLLWFLWMEFKVTGQLIDLMSVGVTTYKS